MTSVQKSFDLRPDSIPDQVGVRLAPGGVGDLADQGALGLWPLMFREAKSGAFDHQAFTTLC